MGQSRAAVSTLFESFPFLYCLSKQLKHSDWGSLLNPHRALMPAYLRTYLANLHSTTAFEKPIELGEMADMLGFTPRKESLTT